MITINTILAADGAEDINDLIRNNDKTVERILRKGIDENPASPLKYVLPPEDGNPGCCWNGVTGCR